MLILLPNTIALTMPADGHEYVVYDAQHPFLVAHAAAEVLVLWGNTAPNLQSAVRDLPNLRLVQTLAAGPDQALAAGFAEPVTICSGRSLHDGPVAEHALAMVLALVRGIGSCMTAQAQHQWDTQIGREQSQPETRQWYTLDGATVVILGYGSIAMRLQPLLLGLGARVIGVAQRAGERAGQAVMAFADVHAVLPRADVVISLLPATPQTDGIVDARFLAACPPHALFVNVGRGKTVDEAALVAALQGGHLRAAALDVTRVEPLPSESALWECPNLLITPHIAGGRPMGAEALVGAQVQALAQHQPLRNVVRP
jgi:phosphoglycerate dehydrogenase-like enzyme